MRSQAALRDRPRNVGVAASDGVAAPYFSVAPTVGPPSGPAATVFTLALGTAVGSPTPTVAYKLYRNGVDVTADMVGLAYTAPAGAADLKWVVTAKNWYGVEEVRLYATVTA